MSKTANYNVIISDRAKQMLGVNIKFLAQASPEGALKLKDNLLKAIRSLELMPQRCPFFNEPYIPSNKYHKLVVQDRYIILFQIKDSNVYVDYVLDCRQDYQWLIY